MADIDIQKKKESPVWIWIVGILALLALIFLIWWLMNRSDGDTTGIVDTEDTTEQVEPRDASVAQTGAVGEYITWTENFDNEMGIHHEFTKNGLQKMANALAAIAERSENVNKSEFDQKLERMRNKADSITNNWESTQHADMIKRAFEASVDVMKELQQTSFSDLQNDVDNVQQEVNRLDTKKLTLEQKERVKSVFRLSADLLRKMENKVGS